MPSDTQSALPDIGEALSAILARVPRAQQPLLIAVAERMAAERYRGWAADPAFAHHGAALRACADREEEIARRIEALYPDAVALQGDLVAGNPELEDLNRTLFAGRPLQQQFTIQARGERLGAATWRSFAKHAEGAARDT